MPDVIVNRRATPRHMLVLAAEIVETVSGAKLKGRTSDVGRYGCYIDILNTVPAGSKVRVRLTHEDEVFEATARVVYVSPGLGMGMHFEDPIPPEQVARLERWLQEAPLV